MLKLYSVICSVGALVLALDQWTKSVALAHLLSEGDSRSFLSWWNWTLVHNHGASFGVFRTLPESVRTPFLILLPFTILTILWWFYLKPIKRPQPLSALSMGLVFGGAIGNLIDRIRFGYVIDFIDWFYPSTQGNCIPLFHRGSWESCHWPVFNVADAAITTAMCLLLIESFLAPKNQA
jgi:signal peptidase II